MGKDKKNKVKKYPFVSICTPTFNRRPFVPMMIKCFEHQTYPKDRLEWIIIDDGTDKIEELVTHIPQVKYYKFDEKLTLGKKRNISNEKAIGDIIVYMDDDDYYPPERVSHAVERLKKNPNALCAGSSAMLIYFKHINKMYQFGPYGPNHSTAATFAFKRELLKKTKFNEEAAVAEEKFFLKDYTIPFVQLDSNKSILVFSHIHNSFDKKELLKNIEQNKYAKNITNVIGDLTQFFVDSDIYNFYVNDLNNHLKNYKYGDISYKPDVTENIKRLKKERIINAKLKHYNILFPNSQITKQDVIVKNDFIFFSETFILKEFMKYEENLRRKQLLIDELFKKIKIEKK